MELTAEERQLVTAPISRKDAVLKLLRNAIVDGRLPAGQRLDQNELAARLGVSRMPVREALKQLETEKLVVVFPYRGVEVASLDPATIVEMFEIRVALESLAVGRAVDCLSKSEFRHDASDTRADGRQSRRPGAVQPWMELNHRFHATINSAGGWPHLVETIDQYRANVERYVRFYLSAGGRIRSQQEHWELLRACESGDVAAAPRRYRETSTQHRLLADRSHPAQRGTGRPEYGARPVNERDQHDASQEGIDMSFQPQSSTAPSRIDVHAHYYSERYVDLIESEGCSCGACVKRDARGPIIDVGPLHAGPLGPRFFDLDLRIAAMDEQRVSAQVLSLTQPMVYWAERVPGAASVGRVQRRPGGRA